MTNRIRTIAAVRCIVIACDRRLAHRGMPLLDNLTAQEKLRRLGYRAVRERVLYPPQNRGDVYTCSYEHPDLDLAVIYTEEQWADGRFWRLVPAPKLGREPAVFRYEYKLGAHAPSVTDADALDAVPEGSDALVIRFHSDAPLRDRRRPPVEDMYGDLVSPIVEPYEVVHAYSLDSGEVRGWSYVLPCRFTGRKSSDGRWIYEDRIGRFVIGGEGGSPERCARFWLCEPALED